ncbi:hypothetical protein [Vulcanococcus limneticus]|uniref:hypothetical protein n=1 Tax=Vulcanococcus limneticus TaxID=2170428 RepID=UPI00398C1B80
MPPSTPSRDSRVRSRQRRRQPSAQRQESVSRMSQWISGLTGLLFLAAALLFGYLVVGEGIDHMASDYETSNLLGSASLEEAEQQRAKRPPRPYPLEPTLQGRMLSRLQRLLQGRIP